MVFVFVNGVLIIYLFNLFVFLICMVMIVLFVVGVLESVKVNNVIVVIKLIVIIVFIVICGVFVIVYFDMLKVNWSLFILVVIGEEGKFGWGGILCVVLIVFFVYIGFEVVLIVG